RRRAPLPRRRARLTKTKIMSDPRAVSLRWHRIYRVVAARHPPINVFEDVVSARQLDMAWHIEGLTNDRLRDESGVGPPGAARGAGGGPPARPGRCPVHP